MRRVIDSRVLDLNPAFLLEHQIAPLRTRGQVLEVGLRDPSDSNAIAALRFATGLEIEAVAMAEAEWAQWSAVLAQAGSMTRAPAVLELGEGTVHVQSPPGLGKSFVVTDREAWRDLRAQLGERPVVALTLRPEVTWQMELTVVPEGPSELRRLVETRSPVRLAKIAWSVPVPGIAGAPATLYCVRKKWLRARLSTVKRELGARAITIVDAAGGSFHLRVEPLRRIRVLAIGVGALALAVGAVMVTNWRGTQGIPQGAEARVRTTQRAVSACVASPAPAPMVTSPTAPNSTANQFELVGIVGRLPTDAVALVRPPWGKAVTLRVGDSLLGWKLASISADRVMLVNGSARQELVIELAPAG